MQGRKLYKTKLCVLYQRGRCVRASCSFAHGEAELRDSPRPSFYPGRRDYNERGSEVRERFPRERRYSREPSRRFSPQRDSSRDRDSLYDRRNISSDRGSSLSRSPVRRERRLDGERERESGSFNSLEEGERETTKREIRNPNSQTDDRDNLLKQIKQLEMDIDMLNDDKYDLELLLEDKHEEEEKLLNKIEDLELQLTKEQQESKRITSNLKKFVRAHNRYIKAQEELKRSQERMERLGELLGPEISKKDEDSSENVAHGNLQKSPLNNNNYNNNDISSVRKRPFVNQDTSEEAKEGNSRKREKYNEAVTKSERNNKKSENIISKWGSMKCSASEENNKSEKEGKEETEKKELKLVDLNDKTEIDA
ncbi:hypothetical protein LUZ60_017415 [Juncus effusus]|nr:hypothetical protein LUZ60_017415 [Juncus effusus]